MYSLWIFRCNRFVWFLMVDSKNALESFWDNGLVIDFISIQMERSFMLFCYWKIFKNLYFN